MTQVEALGYKLETNLTRPMKNKYKGYWNVVTPGGPQEMTVINEAGTYRLIFTSRKEAAECAFGDDPH